MISTALKGIAGLAIATALTGCASGPTVAVAPDATSANFVLRASGSGDWNVECTATTKRGRVAHSRMDGRGSNATGVIAVADTVNAVCDYNAGEAPFTLTLEEEFACPFDTLADGICRTVIEAGTAGSLEFSPL